MVFQLGPSVSVNASDRIQSRCSGYSAGPVDLIFSSSALTRTLSDLNDDAFRDPADYPSCHLLTVED